MMSSWELESLQSILTALEARSMEILVESIGPDGDFLLSYMDNNDMLRLIDGASHLRIHSLYLSCERLLAESVKRYDFINREFQKESARSTVDIQEELVLARYRADKTLNKFERQTDESVRELVAEEFNKAWREHLQKVDGLRKTRSTAQSDIQDWKNKRQLLEDALHDKIEQMRPKLEETDTKQANDIRVKMPDSDADHTKQESRITLTIPMGSPTEAMQTISPHNSSPRTSSEVVVNIPTAIEQDSTHPNLPVTTLIPSLTPCQPPATTHPTVLRELSNPPSATKALNQHSHEYDSNKESKPITPISASLKDKESHKKAFAGLDKYAQSLFKRTPDSRATTPKP